MIPGPVMNYTVKLALFPPWKRPVPYETLARVFATTVEAAEAGAKALAPVIERELASLPFNFKAKSQRAGEGWVTIMDSPTSPAIAA